MWILDKSNTKRLDATFFSKSVVVLTSVSCSSRLALLVEFRPDNSRAFCVLRLDKCCVSQGSLRYS